MRFNFFKKKKSSAEFGLVPQNDDITDSVPEIYRGMQVYEDESDRFAAFDEDAFAGEFYEPKAKRKIPPPKTPPSFFAGIFFGVSLILLVSGAATFFTLFSKSGGVYKTVVVPDLRSLDESSAISQICNDYDCFNYTVEYKNNPRAAEGTVIDQTPDPATVRKLYGINGHITIKLTVSKSSSPITLPNIIGLSARDVTLELQNAGLNVFVSEVYSDTVKAGKIISSSHTVGSQLKKNDTVYITVSLGERVRYTSVPNLIGISESAAISLLKEKELSVGKIIYKTSSLPLGTVIEQSISEKSSVRSESKIDLIISSGSIKID